MSNHKKTILLIRHGQTDWNKEGRWQGHADVPLNQLGKEQASLLAQRLAKWPIDAVLSSDLKRAYQTAVLLSKPHTLTPKGDPIWRERDVGDFQGKTQSELMAAFPDIWQHSKTGILEPPNGETFAKLEQRAGRALQLVLDRDCGHMVAVVSHGQFIHVLLAQIMGITGGIYGRFSLRGNTGLSIIEVNDTEPVVTRLNDTAHLETAAFPGRF